MAKKAAKTKKTATTKTSAKPSHVPTPWLKLKQMWESGESYEAMAKATDALCLAKTLHVRRMNDLEAHLPGALFAMVP